MIRRFALLLVLAAAQPLLAAAPDLSLLKLPPGFHIEVWMPDVPNARSLARATDGTVFVGTRTAGKVYAIRPRADGTRQLLTLASGLNMPNGVAFHDGALFVAETDRIRRYDNIEALLPSLPAPVEIAKLPKESHHGWRYLAVGPDNKLYVPVGAPCNVCNEPDHALILRMNLDGSGREVVARGVRNSVGMDWQPGSKALWFTDNGRDMLGDDVPFCELNRLPALGADFGFPYCHAGDIVDPEFGSLGRCSQAVPPARKLGPHVAPLGVKFYTGKQFPADYRGQLLIAEHGSWNRSVPIGYRISKVRVVGDRTVGYDIFASGWLQANGKVIGRPVDLLQLPDGSMLVSDDQAGVIYRIYYR